MVKTWKEKIWGLLLFAMLGRDLNPGKCRVLALASGYCQFFFLVLELHFFTFSVYLWNGFTGCWPCLVQPLHLLGPLLRARLMCRMPSLRAALKSSETELLRVLRVHVFAGVPPWRCCTPLCWVSSSQTPVVHIGPRSLILPRDEAAASMPGHRRRWKSKLFLLKLVGLPYHWETHLGTPF